MFEARECRQRDVGNLVEVVQMLGKTMQYVKLECTEVRSVMTWSVWSE